jgi:hypothetical protein
MAPPGDPLRDFDRRAHSDKLLPPRKRNPHEPGHMNPALAPIYTQGPPSPYRKLGSLKAVSTSDGSDDTLVSSALYPFLHLIGSKINSTQFNYYVTTTSVIDNTKFELSNKTELFDGDYVTVPDLDNQIYKCSIDKNALPLLLGIV